MVIELKQHEFSDMAVPFFPVCSPSCLRFAHECDLDNSRVGVLKFKNRGRLVVLGRSPNLESQTMTATVLAREEE